MSNTKVFLNKILFPIKVCALQLNKLFTNQTRLMESRIWEKKEVNYTKTLAKIQVTEIFLIQDMRRSFFDEIKRDLYRDAILVPIRICTNMAAGNQQEHLSLSFATKA